MSIIVHKIITLFLIQTEVMNVLRRMYGDNIPEPKKVHCTKWFTNPLMLGSYHVIRPGTSRTDLDNLSRGIRNLHFAGTDYTSTLPCSPAIGHKFIKTLDTRTKNWSLQVTGQLMSTTAFVMARFSPARRKRTRFSRGSERRRRRKVKNKRRRKTASRRKF